ncbi:hypothetical protein [Azospirillum rugosum]|uniref:Uncharacterized protein n=1 Tax=Azospirillum rugosum TaxID=416170 RepID=A0ABS4SJP2_9PROT|nr:hypothetical protein [Azospirillum rugosum]MBP2292785.1 hypothetical protein [Azospirillum rugosum]MDQ0527044.1 hypothetical protein [Azospirillum rugosum]
MLALSAAAIPAATACRAQAIDCWLLEGQALDRAHQRGLCKDAFARNSVGGAPAAGEPVVVPKQTNDAPRDVARGNQRDREVAAVPSPRPATPPAKPKREGTAQSQPRPARAAAPAQSQLPSWSTGREEPSWNTPRPADRVARVEETVPKETAEIPVEPWPVRRQPPPSTDPVEIFMDNLQRDFQSLVTKLISGR